MWNIIEWIISIPLGIALGTIILFISGYMATYFEGLIKKVRGG
jgi:hypothetical protein